MFHATGCPACGEPVGASDDGCASCGTPFIGDEKTERRVDALIGAQVGEYQIQKWLGMGGMGIVYEGLQPAIGKRVAVKVIRPDIMSSDREMERLLEEARTANAIGHRAVVDIFGSGKLPDGRQYLVMEYLSGVPLDVAISSEAPMLPHRALPILDEIFDALTEVHAAGVVHRDIKPSNIFLVSSGRSSISSYVKLLDFGLARHQPTQGRSGKTRASTIAGTPEYISPEQALGLTAVPASDLYAVGVTAFEMLTGRLPFVGASAVQVMADHIESPAPAPSSLVLSMPPELDELVLDLLQKSPADRPASAGVARARVRQLMRLLQERQTAVAPRPTAPEPRQVSPPARAEPRTTQWLQARRRSAVLSAVLSFVAVTSLGMWFLLRPVENVAVVAPPMTSPPPPPPPPAPAPEPAPVIPAEPPLPAPAAVAPVEPPARSSPQEPAPAPARPAASKPVPPRKPQALGRLQLIPARVTGEVFVDGTSRGMLPRPPLDLSPGAHLVVVRNPLLGEVKKTVVLRSGETTGMEIAKEDFVR